jgi:tetratricopeptide (TPR) repeat protein
MAEGMLGGALGGEDDKTEGDVPEPAAGAASGAVAFAAAVAAIASRQDPGVARRTEEFLSDQSHLLKVQTKNLEDENELRLAYLRNQLREQTLRRSGLRLRVAFQLFIALIATVVGAGILVMLRDAFTSRRVVVESFDAPAALVARGVTGKVVASGLLDELRRLQSATRADAAKRELSNAWAGEIELAVPEAGISYRDLSRLLKDRFGEDVHIDGDLVQTDAGGLALTVRGDRVTPRTFTGAAHELDRLTTEAAGYVYAQSEPVLWAYYLLNRGLMEETISFSRAALATADAADRPYLLNTWANASAFIGKGREALPLYRAALKLKPDYWVAHNNVINTHWGLGDEESAWQAGEEMRRVAGGRPGRAPETYYQNVDVLLWDLGRWRAATVADADASGGLGSNVGGSAQVMLADIDIRLHDLAAAGITLQTVDPAPADPSTAVMSHLVRGRLAAELGDTATAVTEMEAFGAMYRDPAVSFTFPGYSCWIPPIEEAAGHPDKADAALASGGRYVDCYRFRGDILDGRGDWDGAQKAYAEAVALAPDLPAGYYSWGLALARHGDLRGAEAKLKNANQRGPHWADPLKAWGDVLIRQGRPNEARAKYDEALKYAPNWAALRADRAASSLAPTH